MKECYEKDYLAILAHWSGIVEHYNSHIESQTCH